MKIFLNYFRDTTDEMAQILKHCQTRWLMALLVFSLLVSFVIASSLLIGVLAFCGIGAGTLAVPQTALGLFGGIIVHAFLFAITVSFYVSAKKAIKRQLTDF